LTKKSGGAPCRRLGVTTFFSKMVGPLTFRQGVTILWWKGLAAMSAGAKTYTFTDKSGRARVIKRALFKIYKLMDES